MTEKLSFKLKPYQCVSCSKERGAPVCELIRMIPESVVFDGKLIGDEYFCCAVCFEPKFDVKKRKPINFKKKLQSNQYDMTGGNNDRPKLRLVKG